MEREREVVQSLPPSLNGGLSVPTYPAEMCVYRCDDDVPMTRVYLQMAHSGACCISMPRLNVKHTKAGDKLSQAQQVSAIERGSIPVVASN
jgi:hypothetical protein